MIQPLKLWNVKAFVARGRRTVLIDSGYPRSERLILYRLKQLKVAPEDVSLVLLTHGHLDHVGSAKPVAEMLDAPVAIHRADVQAVRTGDFPRLTGRTWLGWLTVPFSNVQFLKYTRVFEPDILIDDGLDLASYGVDGQVVHTPGHTPGSVSVVLDNGDAMLGDLVMPRFPAARTAGYPIYADNMDEVRKSVAKVMAMNPKRVFVTHYGPFDPDDVRRFYGL